MPTIKISTAPTLDLEDITVLSIDNNKQLFFKTNKVYSFDGVYAIAVNRSRVLRPEKEESQIIESVCHAVIDAGFVGYIAGKMILTNSGYDKLDNLLKKGDNESVISTIKGCVSLWMIPSPAGNYYNGSNQTQLVPDYIITL